jgi:SAM-dependent methyltransferase
MVYIACIEDDHALIFDGPVVCGQSDLSILTSCNLEDAREAWEFQFLPDREAEWPALRENAIDALQHIETWINKPFHERSILDFGSGWGFFLAVAKERNWKTYGLEPLPGSAVYARAKFGLDIITNTLREGLFPPESFDAITSFQVFEHLPFPERDIQSLYKVLRPGGILLIEVPNFETWTMPIMKGRHRHFTQDHLNFFSYRTLGEFLEKNGLQVVDQYHPTRCMSIHHMFKGWILKSLPASKTGTVQNLLQRTRISEQTIKINIGDIITVIARKPE